jgi:hypothetical protein
MSNDLLSLICGASPSWLETKAEELKFRAALRSMFDGGISEWLKKSLSPVE